jgi:putative transposase
MLDLFSRQVIGSSMQPCMESGLAMSALMMAVWRRQPKQGVIVHSASGSAVTTGNISCRRTTWLPARGNGNCHGDAVAESFFQLLKRERIRRDLC